jgi:hypothetical protein
MKTFVLFLLFLTLFFVVVQPTFTETPSIEVDYSRHLDKVAILGSFVIVQLNCSLKGNISGLIITERIPNEFKFVNSSSNPPANAAKYNEPASEVKWLFISLQQTSEIVIAYTLEVPINIEEKNYTIEGYWKAVDRETRASGVSPILEIQVESERQTENSFGSTVPIRSLIIVVLIAATAVVIVVFLTRKHGFARRG